MKRGQLPIPYQSLRSIFKEIITVEEIAEPLECCDPNDEATIVYDRLRRLNYEVIGIGESGVITGYVEKDDLMEADRCKDVIRLFSPRQLITNTTPLMEIFPILRKVRRIFVLDHNRNVNIITRADLQKIPVRMLLFGLVSLLEMHMLRVIRSTYPNQEWKALLKQSRFEKSEELLRARKERNEAVDLADCLQFSDKKEIILNSEQIRTDLKIQSKKKGNAMFGKVEALRDKLAHAQDLVTGKSWQEIFDVIEESERLLERLEKIK